MRRHRRAWDNRIRPNTRSAKVTLDLRRGWVCDNADCINHEHPSHETYWLCEECWKVAPSIIHYCTHAPYKVLPPKKKQQAASASAFAVWAKNRPRKPRDTAPAGD